MSMAGNPVILLFILALLAGGIFLQIYLSKRKSRWLGLILPGIPFLYSLLMVFSAAVYDGMTGSHIFVLLASVFLLSNIPTIIFLGIYFGCRGKMKLRAQLDKMNIQDLD